LKLLIFMQQESSSKSYNSILFHCTLLQYHACLHDMFLCDPF
jgi:hypothetical protein